MSAKTRRSARIIAPKNRLVERCASASGPSSADLIARMEAALAAHVEANRHFIPERVNELRGLAAAGHGDALLAAAHEIKGLAATFGYPLVGRMAESLCRYLRGQAPRGPGDDTVIAMHVDAMLAAVSEDGARARTITDEVAAGLEEVVARALK